MRNLPLFGPDSARVDFERLVALYYEVLYQFAFSLTRSEADACDLTQETFYLWATKGGQLRDASKVKTWLFTTLHRAFLQGRRWGSRFPHFELGQMETELDGIEPEHAPQLDPQAVLIALARVDEPYKSTLALFYLEDFSYPEIARMLEIPLGTVKSRIARGLGQLQRFLTSPAAACGGTTPRLALASRS